MSRSKEQWLERTGGFFAGEPKAMFTLRLREIGRLERLLRSGKLTGNEPEKTLCQLCRLKGIYLDGYDPPDD